MYLTIFGKPRYLGLVTAEDDILFDKGELLLVESSRGIETAVVAGKITERQEYLYRSIDNRQEGQSGGDSGLQNIAYIRKASESDLSAERENRIEEDGVLVTARQVLSRHDLDMKLVDVEYMIDRRKLFLYFTSEQRVDFRAYVRDLAREFRTRIELRQIGVRDEAKVVKGIGACGRVCCCSYWLQRFMPIGIKMVKEQNLALNPTKISGLCGRLMCCMSYEHENYRELWSYLPSHGSKIRTDQGNWVLTGVDLATDACTVHGPEGNVCVNVQLYQKFKETVQSGAEWKNEDCGCDDRGRIIDKELFDGIKNGCACAGCGSCAVKSPAAPDDNDKVRVDSEHQPTARSESARTQRRESGSQQTGRRERPRKRPVRETSENDAQYESGTRAENDRKRENASSNRRRDNQAASDRQSRKGHDRQERQTEHPDGERGHSGRWRGHSGRRPVKTSGTEG